MDHYLYILASQKYGTLYIGITHNLVRRIYEHKNQKIIGFTEKYNCLILVHIEKYSLMMDAVAREKN